MRLYAREYAYAFFRTRMRRSVLQRAIFNEELPVRVSRAFPALSLSLAIVSLSLSLCCCVLYTLIRIYIITYIARTLLADSVSPVIRHYSTKRNGTWNYLFDPTTPSRFTLHFTSQDFFFFFFFWLSFVYFISRWFFSSFHAKKKKKLALFFSFQRDAWDFVVDGIQPKGLLKTLAGHFDSSRYIRQSCIFFFLSW